MQEQVSLYFREGSSDKEYHAQLVPDSTGNGWLVNYQYGRRGSTLTVGSKTPSAVDYEAAKDAYDKLVKSKKAKGYTEGESGSPYTGGDKEERKSDYYVQLSNPIEPERVRGLLQDPDWAVQEKYDGKRMLLRYDGSEVTAINRTGLVCGAPEIVTKTFHAWVGGSRETVIDGEAIGDRYVAWDVLVVDGNDVRKEPYINRLKLLKIYEAGGMFETGVLELAPTAIGDELVKFDAYTDALADNKEGIMLKRLDAPYTAGRPASGGNVLKFKFVEEATCRVKAIKTDKRSMIVEMRNGEEVGSVTIPPNKAIPEVGQLVEIRYLYAFMGGSLYQPFFKAVRDDKTEADTYESLKFKG